jgi:hypothetical protein
MKNIRKISWLVSLAVMAFVAVHVTAQSANPSFTLKLSPKNTEFRASENIWVKIVQTNTSSQQVSCAYAGGNGVNRQYRYEVTDENGKPAEKIVQSPYIPPPGDYMQCEIDPGESNTNLICLSNVFQLDKPGKYTINVWRPDPDAKDSDGNPVKVYSNTITITITG